MKKRSGNEDQLTVVKVCEGEVSGETPFLAHI